MKRNRLLLALLLCATAAALIMAWLWPANKGQSNKLQPKAANGPTSGAATNTADGLQSVNSPGVKESINGRPAFPNQFAPSSEAPPTQRPETGLAASEPGVKVASTNGYPRPVQNVFELQVALARAAISCGSIDGVMGRQTRLALSSFQKKLGLAVTGELDEPTRGQLVLRQPLLATYVVSSNDLKCLQPLSPTWVGKSRQSVLAYETLLECVSEKCHSSPALVRRLNPAITWSNVPVCTTLELPDVSYPQPKTKAACITIYLSQRTLEACDAQTNLLAHFPCSIARQVEKRPLGALSVAVVALQPNYTFDPENFPDSAEARELQTKLVLPSGPNNPVGVAWIGLDKPGYGIHGTPQPEHVGRTESHGCFRLTNWDAEYLARLVSIGTPVYVQP